MAVLYLRKVLRLLFHFPVYLILFIRFNLKFKSILKLKRLILVSQIVYVSHPLGRLRELLFLSAASQLIFIIDDFVDDYLISPEKIRSSIQSKNNKPEFKELDVLVDYLCSVRNLLGNIDSITFEDFKNCLGEFLDNIELEQNEKSLAMLKEIRKRTSGIPYYSKVLGFFHNYKIDDPKFNAFCTDAGRLVRLANDIRSYEKEKNDNSPNEIKFLINDGVTESDAIERARGELVCLFNEFNEKKKHTDINQNFYNYVEFIVRMYNKTDFHQPKFKLISVFLSIYFK